MLAILAVNCGGAVGPSASAHLEVSGAATALKVGEQCALTVVLVDEGSRRQVQAVWMIDSGSAAQVLPDGTATGMSPGIDHLHALYGSYESSVDLRVVNNFAGAWHGSYRDDTCERLSGPGSSYCRFELNQVFPVDIALSQDGASISGSTMFYSTGGRPVLSGFLTGTSDTAGNLLLTGIITAIDPSEQPETTTIDGWRSQLSSTGEMSGQFVQHRQFTNAFGPQVSIEGCSLLKTTHAP
jgi:hypothetical protein